MTSSHLTAVNDEVCLCRVPGIVWAELDMVKVRMKKAAGAGVEMAVSTASAKQWRHERYADLRRRQ
jgi:hypothetical protein